MKTCWEQLPCSIALAMVILLSSCVSIATAAEKAAAAAAAAPSLLVSRDFKINHRFLNIPVKRGATKQKLALLVGGAPMVVNEIELAESDPDWWAFVDMKAWQGQTATLQVIGPQARSLFLDQIEMADSFKGTEELYREALRPLIHFSSRRGWINDPNGLVYYNGEYHRFYQHNPYGWDWGNMHWGHSTSRDLVHWEEHGDVLMPDSFGTMCSGSAVVDWENTSGFGREGRAPLVLVYTAGGSPLTQCIAFSTDGRNFFKYANNPVVGEVTPHNRDPKVFWHAPTKRWVMVLNTTAPAGTGVVDEDGKPALLSLFQFFTSPNLREWTPTTTTAGGIGKDPFLVDCPDFFELPLGGDSNTKKWVISGGSGEYAVGTFDGERFVPETAKIRGMYGAYWAAQSFNDAPDGRRLQIAWGVAPSPGMPFNMLHLLPCELSLKQTEEGPRLVRLPVRELVSLRDGPDQSQALAKFSSEAVEFRAEIEAGQAGVFEADVRGMKIAYDTRTQELSVNGTRAHAPWVDGRQSIIVYVDRTVTEVFASDGLTYIAEPYIPPVDNRSVSVKMGKGTAKMRFLEVYKLRSIW